MFCGVDGQFKCRVRIARKVSLELLVRIAMFSDEKKHKKCHVYHGVDAKKFHGAENHL